MFGRWLTTAALSLAGCAPTAPPPVAGTALTAQQWAAACPEDAGWDDPGPPFRIHGNTWYVGTCGIAAILVTGASGHVLIDSGTEAGAERVLANVARLGFRPGDIKLLLMSHEHHDHIGGMARIKQATGARLLASAAAAPVMTAGRASADDPQFGVNSPFAPVAPDGIAIPGEEVILGDLRLLPMATPGHTPGALSWTWRSCDGSDCRTLVLADSLTAISSDSYRFTDHPRYVAAFRAGLATLEATNCDMILTPHPGASDMYRRAAGGLPSDRTGCARYAREKAAALDARLAKEVVK